MELIVKVMAENPLLTVFFVAGAGFLLGRVRVANVSFGVAMVLFLGLGVGALDERIALPEILTQLGLVVFIYTLGLGNGASFVRSLSRDGWRTLAVVLASLGVTAGVWYAGHRWLGISGPVAAGGFSGSVTNTPSLAAVLDLAGGNPLPTIGYTVAYPMGVIALLLVMSAFAAIQRRRGQSMAPPKVEFVNQTVRVTRADAEGRTVAEAVDAYGLRVIFGRILRDDRTILVAHDLRLERDDLITIIGEAAAVTRAVEVLGEPSDAHPEHDRSTIDYRRMFVSNPQVFGKSLAELRLPQEYGAIVSRLSRGDMEFLPTGETRLQPGDRVRVVTYRENMTALRGLFGDSYRALAEIDVLSFGLGICLGLLLGMVTVPLPGGVTFKLGVAGGPLVVSLILGAIHTTGPIRWDLSDNANLTLRQLGLVLFLAGVGVRSGYAFRQEIVSGSAWSAFGVGVVATAATAITCVLMAAWLFRAPIATHLGMVAGVHTQPAALSFGLEQAKHDQVNFGYATVFPIASISKILIAQVLYQLMAP
ncbi:MAG: TrkA C-terminal domain-containing protein [Fimbriimonadaceae bacterium]|nr:TrkA C-terminal domain-containing protein [Fimbriimonadaceae bacterium]